MFPVLCQDCILPGLIINMYSTSKVMNTFTRINFSVAQMPRVLSTNREAVNFSSKTLSVCAS